MRNAGHCQPASLDFNFTRLCINLSKKGDSMGVDYSGSRHWSEDLPYRAIVPIKLHSTAGPMLFQVAGSTQSSCGAEKALRIAMRIHGGSCHYCKLAIKAGANANDWTLDHVEPSALGGNGHLGNLMVACKPCNLKKGHQPIDTFNPHAAAEWLTGLQKQVQQRLARLKAKSAPTPPSSLPQPKQAAATGP
jgi:HNH endonuclease